MASHLGKAFAKASAEAARQFEDSAAVQKPVKDAEQILREESAPMTAADAIQRILLAWKDQDYFRLLALPPVEVDALGNAAWDCTDADISKAYRKLSVLVHPDKNPGDEARLAFEHVNEAHRILKDPGKLSEEKQRQLSAAQERQAKREATATVQERIVINALKAKQAKAIRAAEEEALRNAIVQQAKARQEAGKRRREAKKRRVDSDEEPGAFDGGALHASGPSEQAPPVPAISIHTNDDDAESNAKVTRDDSDDDNDTVKRLARVRNSRPKVRKSTF